MPATDQTTQTRLDQIAVKTWTVEGQALTGEQVCGLYWRLRLVGELSPRKVGDVSRSGRRMGRATSILKRAGLIRFNRPEWRWEVVDACD